MSSTQKLAPVPVLGRQRSYERRTTTRAYLFLAPALILVVLLFLIPLGYNIVISFFDWSVIGRREFIGLENYVSVISSDRFLNAAGNTLYFTLLGVPAGVVLSLLVALGFNALLVRRGSALIRALYFAPVVASLTAVAFVWLWIFNPAYGLANSVWSQDLPHARAVAAQLHAGNSWINAHNVFAYGLPYGGIGMSGWGGGVNSVKTYLDYLRPLTIARPL